MSAYVGSSKNLKNVRECVPVTLNPKRVRACSGHLAAVKTLLCLPTPVSTSNGGGEKDLPRAVSAELAKLGAEEKGRRSGLPL